MILLQTYSKYKQISFHLILALFLIGLFSKNICAQSAILPSCLTTEELQQIEKEDNEQNRVKRLLKLSILRLKMAHQDIETQNYEEASNKIRDYGILINYTFAFINNSTKKDDDKKKMFKLLDLSVRKGLAMLKVLRYEFSGKYFEDTNVVHQKVCEVRTFALAELFGKEFFPTNNK